jgi:hypothetical protein
MRKGRHGPSGEEGTLSPLEYRNRHHIELIDKFIGNGNVLLVVYMLDLKCKVTQ